MCVNGVRGERRSASRKTEETLLQQEVHDAGESATVEVGGLAVWR